MLLRPAKAIAISRPLLGLDTTSLLLLPLLLLWISRLFHTVLCIGDDSIMMDAEPYGLKMLHSDGLVVNYGAIPDCCCSWLFKTYSRTLDVWFTPSGVKQR